MDGDKYKRKKNIKAYDYIFMIMTYEMTRGLQMLDFKHKVSMQLPVYTIYNLLLIVIFKNVHQEVLCHLSPSPEETSKQNTSLNEDWHGGREDEFSSDDEDEDRQLTSKKKRSTNLVGEKAAAPKGLVPRKRINTNPNRRRISEVCVFKCVHIPFNIKSL
jgi:hypothetical protein